jgi:predicted ATPase
VVAGVPILVLATYRSGYRPLWLAKSYATQLALQRLTLGDSLRMVQTVLQPAQVPAALAQAIVAKAEGNPFFLEELARTVVEQGDRRLPLAVPDTIHALLAARIDRLPPAEKRLLQAAAIIGKDIALPLLQSLAVLPEEGLRPALLHLQAAEFFYETRLVPEPTYTFKHVLTQEVAYQSLLQRTREQYHQQIAQVVEEQFPEIAATQPEWLAQHYTAAGLTAQAIPYWRHAGQRAIERSAYVEAISHLTQGLKVLKTLPETPERTQQELDLQTALGLSLMATRGYAAVEVEHAYARARELCQQVGDTPQLFRVLVGLWRFYLLRGQFQTARELAEQLLTLTQRGHDPLGVTLYYLGELTAARAHLEQAMAHYALQKRRSIASRDVQDPGVGCLSYMAWILWLLGYPDQALKMSHEALTLAQELAHPFSLAFGLCFATILHQLRCEEQVTQQRAEALIALSCEQGFPYWLAYGTIYHGWALATQGQVAEGIAQMHQGLAAHRATGPELNTSHHLAMLAEAFGREGQTEEGLGVLAEALAAVHKSGERRWEAELYRLKGKLLLRQPIGAALRPVPTEDAEACFQQALAIARRQQAKSLELRAAMSLARLWRQQGQRAEARALLAPIYSWFTEGFDTADLQEARALLEALA